MSPNTPWNPGIWQISALAGAASYAEVFIKNGVALIGPGDAGEWRPDRDDTDFEGSAVRRFATEVKQGDVFLLRTAANRISAVGLVASDYLFSDQFDDVYGRDLQHARRVMVVPAPTGVRICRGIVRKSSSEILTDRELRRAIVRATILGVSTYLVADGSIAQLAGRSTRDQRSPQSVDQHCLPGGRLGAALPRLQTVRERSH